MKGPEEANGRGGQRHEAREREEGRTLGGQTPRSQKKAWRAGGQRPEQEARDRRSEEPRRSQRPEARGPISNPIGQIDKYISKTKAISSQIGQIATYTSKIEGKIKTNS